MIYPRVIYSKLEKELESDVAVVITGMRRVGKTTALHHLYSLVKSQNKVIFDLEQPLTRNLFQTDNYDSILSSLQTFGINASERAYIFLDEIQNYPPITRIIKYLHDHYNTKFFVTGSSSYYLKNLFPESLSGRKLIFEMYPLTFHEFVEFHRNNLKINIPSYPSELPARVSSKNTTIHSYLQPLYLEYQNYGGFPEVVFEQNLERKKLLLLDIFRSYFEIDAKSLSDFRDIESLKHLIQLLVPRIGSKLDISKLASELGISRETVGNYLSFLESTYFITRLYRFSNSIDRTLSGPKKLFFCDVGIANALGALSTGQALEQSLFQSLRVEKELHYYSTPKGGEIDFVVGRSLALEVKKHASPQDIANLDKRMLSAGINSGYIISQDYSTSSRVILAIDI